MSEVRKPDLVVITRAESGRVERQGGLIRASGVVLAVEIIAPGSRRTDTLIKRAEYADAGIAHYWIVDLDPRPSLTACQLGEHSYQDAAPAIGTFTTEAPFPVDLDLDALG